MAHMRLQGRRLSEARGSLGRCRRGRLRAYSATLAALLFGLATAALATDYYVNGTGGNNAYDGLAAAWDGTHGPKATIQAAIDAAAAGDTITVAQGTYTGAISFGGRNLTLRNCCHVAAGLAGLVALPPGPRWRTTGPPA